MIPRIGASYVVVKGTGTEDLKSGPGIYPETSFPGGGSTTAIAGHRTTYLAPFRHIDSLRPGNRIMLDMPYAHFTYTVIGQRVVSPSDVRPRRAVATRGWSCRPARRCSAPKNACSCSRADPHRAGRRGAGASRRRAGHADRTLRCAARQAPAKRSPAVLESLSPISCPRVVQQRDPRRAPRGTSPIQVTRPAAGLAEGPLDASRLRRGAQKHSS